MDLAAAVGAIGVFFGAVLAAIAITGARYSPGSVAIVVGCVLVPVAWWLGIVVDRKFSRWERYESM